MAKQTIKVIIPTDAAGMTELARLCIKKHTTDGANSVLPNSIMQTMQSLYDTASVKNQEQTVLKKNAETATEDRNLVLGTNEKQNRYTANTALFYVTSIRDYLLGFYRGNERKLGTYGFVVNSPKGDVKVDIPKNADELTTLANTIVKAHNNSMPNSVIPATLIDPLTVLVAQAATLVEKAAQLSRDGEAATQSRNLLLGVSKGQNSKTPNTIRFCLSSVRDMLLGLYRGQEQRLGDWGFEVNSSAASANNQADVAVVDDNTNDPVTDDTIGE